MAKVVSGPYVGFSGTVDNVTYSQQKDGTTTAKRKNKPRSVPATAKQLVTEEDTRITAKFMKPLKEIALVGFDLEAKKTGMNHYNAMSRYNRKAAIQGVYPERAADYSKALMTKGELPGCDDAGAEMTAEGAVVSWTTEISSAATHYSDQVIMIACIPELKEARYITGAQRHIGKDLLNLKGIKKGYTVHLYIAFISNDHRSISDSVYLESHIW